MKSRNVLKQVKKCRARFSCSSCFSWSINALTRERLPKIITLPSVLLGLLTIGCFHAHADDNGLIVKVGTNDSVPIVPMETADDTSYWFLLSFESEGVGLFKNTTAGQALMAQAVAEQLGISFAPSAKLNIASNNALGIFSIDADSVVIDRSAMTLHVVDY